MRTTTALDRIKDLINEVNANRQIVEAGEFWVSRSELDLRADVEAGRCVQDTPGVRPEIFLMARTVWAFAKVELERRSDACGA